MSVEIEDGTEEIPDWILDKIEAKPNSQKEVQDVAIVNFILERLETDAWVTVRQVANHFGITAEGARPRLEELQELRVLDSEPAGGGKVYWLRDDRSDWPIPPDVRVESMEGELLVSDLLERRWTLYIAVSLAAGFFGSLLMTLFVSAELLNLDFPPEILTGVFLAVIVLALGAVTFFILTAISYVFEVQSRR